MLNNHYQKYDINILNEILQNVFSIYIFGISNLSFVK